MNFSNLVFLLHADLPERTCYIVGQQYADKFPEIVMVELSNGTDTPHFQYRFEIFRDIEDGWTYFTAHKNGGKLTTIDKLMVVKVAGEKYLRIDRCDEARDHLGDIPEI